MIQYIDILLASKLFKSKSDCLRHVKQQCVSINGWKVTDINEEFEGGEFLNFVWFPGAIELIKQTGKNNFVIVARGKTKALLQIEETVVKLLT